MPPPHHHDHDHHHHHHHDHHHHHHHHHHHFCERIWEDLPPSAVDAAKVLGYSAETWNAAKILPYLDKPFAKLTSDEKRACVYLSKSPIDYRMQEQWNDLDATLQKHAQVLGWDEHKWNKNDSIKEVECDHWWWQDMTEEQRAAGKYFGYNQNLWDEQGQEEEFSAASATSVPNFDNFNMNDTEKKAAAEEEEEIHVAPPSASSSGDKKASKKHSKINPDALKQFSQSQYFGGESGDEFNHGNNRHIDAITLHADSNMVHGISIQYHGDRLHKVGSCGLPGQTLKFRPGEYVTAVKVRATKHVHSITLLSNRGTAVSAGGKKGDEKEVHAPSGNVLVGLMGRAGKHVNAIAFRWGPMPPKK